MKKRSISYFKDQCRRCTAGLLLVAILLQSCTGNGLQMPPQWRPSAPHHDPNTLPPAQNEPHTNELSAETKHDPVKPIKRPTKDVALERCDRETVKSKRKALGDDKALGSIKTLGGETVYFVKDKNSGVLNVRVRDKAGRWIQQVRTERLPQPILAHAKRKVLQAYLSGVYARCKLPLSTDPNTRWATVAFFPKLLGGMSSSESESCDLDALIEKIEAHLQEVDKLIELRLTEGEKHEKKLSKQLKSLKRLIADLEDEDESVYGRYKYAYHSQNATYFNVMGKEKEEEKQKELAAKYEKFKRQETPDQKDALHAEPNDFSQIEIDSLFVENKDQQAEIDRIEQKLLKELEGHLKKESLDNLKSFLKQVDVLSLKELDDYKALTECEKQYRALITELLLTTQDKKICGKLKKLNQLLLYKTYRPKIEFIQRLLALPNTGEALFKGVELTEECVKKRYQKLVVLFHPDKSAWLRNEHEVLAKDLTQRIHAYKEVLMKKLEQACSRSGMIAFHKAAAYEAWKLAIDYRNASRGQWSKLKVLEQEKLQYHFLPADLKELSINHSMSAYKQYRAACKAADRACLLKEQLKLRGHMAMCLYLAEKPLEAKVCALTAMHLIFKNSNHATGADLAEARKIFDKVSQNHAKQDTEQKNPQTSEDFSRALVKMQSRALAEVPSHALVLTESVSNNYNFTQKRKEQKIAKDLLQKALVECTVGPGNQALALLETSKKEITVAKTCSKICKVGGRGAQILGGVGGIGCLAEAGLGYVGTSAIIAGPFGIAAGIGLAVGCAVLGLWGGYALVEKGTELLEEPEVRESLNKIIEDALQKYAKGDMQGFLTEIQKEDKRGKQIFSTGFGSDGMENSAKYLIQRGFRPDGIAYVFNAIGEALISDKIKVEGKTNSDLFTTASDIFQSVCCDTLREESERLDEVCKAQNFSTKPLQWVKNWVLEEHMEAANKISFVNRLLEFQHLAQLNLALVYIIQSEFDHAKKEINDLKKSIQEHGKNSEMAADRLEVVEDFLWIISGTPPQEDVKAIAMPSDANTAPLPNAMLPQDYLKYLQERLKKAASRKEKITLHNKIAALYEQKALERQERDNKIERMRLYQEAEKVYRKVLRMESQQPEALLGAARCWLGLSKYKRAKALLQGVAEEDTLRQSSEYQYILSMCCRKMKQYTGARYCIEEALRLNPTHELAKREYALLKRLRDRPVKDKISFYQTQKEDIGFSYVARDEDASHYKILALDGGGVRGVLPALWLSEIERRVRKPISSIFDMVSGTSTGGILAAGLTCPKSRLQSRPRYRASDLLDLYTSRAEEIFSKTDLFSSLFGTKPKYTDQGRKSLFTHYFGQARLNKSLTELVVPAVCEQNMCKTYLFNRRDARENSQKNHTLVDVLMATTAAPTFFSAYEVPGEGVFVDGGVHANHPALQAYHEAVRYTVPKDKVFVLSMGTGSYMPDPLHPDLHRGQLFWAQNLHKVTLPAQEGNTDTQMYNLLGDQYKRWQVWLEDPMPLDAYSKMDALLDIGNEYLEEQYASDENAMNKLLEFLEKE